MYTNTMRFTGLSGIDTEMMVRQLMRAESAKYDKLKKKNVMIEWKQDAYRNVALSLNTFQNTFLSLTSQNSLRMISTFNTFAAKTSLRTQDTSLVSVSAGPEAQAGSYRVQVLEMARADLYEGASFRRESISAAKAFDINSIMTPLSNSDPGGPREGDALKFTLDGLTRSINIGALKKSALDDLNFLGIDPNGQYIDPITSAPLSPDRTYLENEFMARLQAELNRQFGSGKITVGFDEITVGSEQKIALQFKTTGRDLAIESGSPRFVNGMSGGSDALGGTLAGLGSLATGTYEFSVTVKDPYDSGKNVTHDISVKLDGKGSAFQNFTAINEALAARGLSNLELGFNGDGNLMFKASDLLKDIEITSGGAPSDRDLLMIAGFSSAPIELTAAGALMDDLGFSASGEKTSLDIKKTNMATLLNIDISDTFDFNDPSAVNKSITINGVAFSFNIFESVEDVMNRINNSNAGARLSFNAYTQRFALESKQTGQASRISLGNLGGTDDTQSFMEGLFGAKFSEADPYAGIYTEATDARIKVNDREIFTSSTNSVEAFGFRVNINSPSAVSPETVPGTPTASDPDPDPVINPNPNIFDIVITRDSSKALEAIKNFVEGYNKLIDEINSLVSTPRARSGKYSYYDPLTDEERDAMSDKEIEKWEEKAREGLLYRDPVLAEITSSMRRLLYQSVEISDGVRMSLYDLGITTTSRYQDQGKLEIDEVKLMKALEERGDDVAKLFTKSSSISYSPVTGRAPQGRLNEEGLAERINDIINDAVNSTSGTIAKQAGIKGASSESNNVLYRQWIANQSRLSEMLAALIKKEDYYFGMFSRMEAAMMQSNTQMQYLTAMLGQSVQ